MRTAELHQQRAEVGPGLGQRVVELDGAEEVRAGPPRQSPMARTTTLRLTWADGVVGAECQQAGEGLGGLRQAGPAPARPGRGWHDRPGTSGRKAIGPLDQLDGQVGPPLLVADHPQQAARLGVVGVAGQGRLVEPRRPGQVGPPDAAEVLAPISPCIVGVVVVTGRPP